MEDLIAFMSELDGDVNAEHLWFTLSNCLLSSGVKSIFYRHIPLIAGESFDPKYLYTKNIKLAVTDRYITERFYEFDILQMMDFTEVPVDKWLTDQSLQTFKAPQSAFVNLLLESMGGEILILPVYGASNRSGYFCLSFNGPRTEVSEMTLRVCKIACNYAHTKYVKNLAQEKNPLDLLSRRELEIIRWVGRGKRNCVIADIMGISRHTVDTYLRRVFIKLEVKDRTTAVLKALNMGLIIS